MIVDLVEELDWPAFYRAMRDRAAFIGPTALRVADRIAQRRGDEHYALATLVLRLPAAMLTTIPSAAPSLSDVEAFELGRWLCHAASEADGGVGIVHLPEIGPLLPTRRARLEMPAELANRLPPRLVWLAGTIAQRQPGRRLVVVAEDLSEVECLGMYSPQTHAGLVALDVERINSDHGAALSDVFAHELAHAVDPHLVSRDVIDRETFAEELAPLLLTRQPTTATELDGLISSVSRVAPTDDEPHDRFARLRFMRAPLHAAGASPVSFPGEGCPATAMVAAVKAGFTQRAAAPVAVA